MEQALAWNAVEYLETEADIEAYQKAALEDGDPAVVAAALDDIARAEIQLSK